MRTYLNSEIPRGKNHGSFAPPQFRSFSQINLTKTLLALAIGALFASPSYAANDLIFGNETINDWHEISNDQEIGQIIATDTTFTKPDAVEISSGKVTIDSIKIQGTEENGPVVVDEDFLYAHAFAQGDDLTITNGITADNVQTNQHVIWLNGNGTSTKNVMTVGGVSISNVTIDRSTGWSGDDVNAIQIKNGVEYVIPTITVTDLKATGDARTNRLSGIAIEGSDIPDGVVDSLTAKNIISELTNLGDFAAGIEIENADIGQLNSIVVDTVKAQNTVNGVRMTESTINFNSLDVKNITSINGTAYGFNTGGNASNDVDVHYGSIAVNGVEGNNARGIYVGTYFDLISSDTGSGLVDIDNITAKQYAYGIDHRTTHSMTAQQIYINSVTSTEKNAYGLYVEKGLMDSTGINIDGVTAFDEALGIYTYTGTSLVSDTVQINNVKGGNVATGIYVRNKFDGKQIAVTNVEASNGNAYGQRFNDAILNADGDDKLDVVVQSVKVAGTAGNAYGVYVEGKTQGQFGQVQISDVSSLSEESKAESAGLLNNGSNELVADSIKVSNISGIDGKTYGILSQSKQALTSDWIDIDDVSAGTGTAYGIHAAALNNGSQISNQIQIDNITGEVSYGMYVSQSANTGFVHINGITATGDYGIATGIQTRNGDSSFYGMSVNNIQSKRTAYGVDVQSGTASYANMLNVTSVHGDNLAYGVRSEASELSLNGGVFVNSVGGMDINSTEGTLTETAYGVSLSNTVNVSSLSSISSISGNEAYGVELNNSNGHWENLNVSSISGISKAYGLQLSATSENGVSIDNLLIDQIQSDKLAIALNMKDGAQLTLENVTINPENWTSYQGSFNADASDQSNQINTLAIRAVEDSVLDLTSDSGTKTIYGTILAASGSTDKDALGGHIKIGGQGVQIYGDVYAGNNGTVDITLNYGSILEGQIDDYHELNSVAQGTVFKNTSFTTGEVAHAGKATLTLNGGQWIARGQSFVDTLTFGSQGGLVDLSKNENSSVSINTLTGSGEFTMRLDNDATKSDMLYIQNLDPNAKYQVNVVLNDTTRSVYELEDVRIATTNGHYQSWGDNFTAVLADQGINDVTFTVSKEEFRTDDKDNTLINGSDDGSGSYKPGEVAVNEIYGNKEGGATNWVINKKEETDPGTDPEEPGTDPEEPTGPSTSLSDAGNALLATARGTYWTAVEIDRLTNRMGDARYANNGDDGLWIRLRQSRLGTDSGEGDFKSDNTVYQVGYDHAFQRDGGRQLVGIAFDYMDTDLDYKGISGEGNTDRYGVTAYTTWLADNGFYVDVVGKWGRLDNDFDIINGSGGRVKADYDNNMWAISAEFGKKLSNPKTGMFIEPNAQLQYTMVTDAQYSTNQGTRVDQDRIDSVIARAGVRIGRAFGETQSNTIYAKADMFREFFGEQKIHVKDVTTHVEGDTITVQNKGFWFDVGGGFQAQLGKNTYAYADVEYRWGDDLDKSWLVNAGARFEF